MMSSAKQTDERPIARIVWAVCGAMLVIGWAFIVIAHGWAMTTSVLVMMLAWLAIVLTGQFLFGVARAIAHSTRGAVDDWAPVGRHEDLHSEKKTLLKAIKDIEFDHQMGKMTAEDAEVLTQHYRQKAREVIKAIKQLEETGDVEQEGTQSISDRIRREVNARVDADKEVDRAKSKAKAKANAKTKTKPSKSAAKAKKRSGGKKKKDAAAATEPGHDAEVDSETDSETDGEALTDESAAEARTEIEAEGQAPGDETAGDEAGDDVADAADDDLEAAAEALAKAAAEADADADAELDAALRQAGEGTG